MKRSNERVEVLNKIITEVAARNCYKFQSRDFDDIYQELWVTVLAREEQVQEDLDDLYIYKMCNNHIAEMQRYDMKRNLISLDIVLDTTEPYSTMNDALEEISIKDLIKSYPEDTPERVYLEYYCTAAGIIDYGYVPKSKYKEGFTEDELAKLLGFNSCSNSGYRTLRKSMRDVVNRYFGKNMKKTENSD